MNLAHVCILLAFGLQVGAQTQVAGQDPVCYTFDNSAEGVQMFNYWSRGNNNNPQNTIPYNDDGLFTIAKFAYPNKAELVFPETLQVNQQTAFSFRYFRTDPAPILAVNFRVLSNEGYNEVIRVVTITQATISKQWTTFKGSCAYGTGGSCCVGKSKNDTCDGQFSIQLSHATTSDNYVFAIDSFSINDGNCKNPKPAVPDVPIMTVQPRDQTVTEGFYLSIDCEFGGPSRKCYWLKDSVELPLLSDHYKLGDPQYGHCTLTIQNTASADAGQYQCAIRGSGPEPVYKSRVARVTIKPNPAYAIKPSSIPAVTEESTYWTMSPQETDATTSVVPPTYQPISGAPFWHFFPLPKRFQAWISLDF